MPASPKDINALTAKLVRAEEHIRNLREFWNEFREKAYPIETEDMSGAYRKYSLGSVAPMPPNIPLITGDVVHNLRTALDHFAHRLVCVGTNDPGPFDFVHFPTGESAKEVKDSIRAISKCLKPDAVEALKKVEAYPAGAGQLLWHIHQLDIIDKHRLLLTVASQNRLQSMSPAEIARIREQFSDTLADIPEANDPFIFLKSGTPSFPLETGTMLAFLPIEKVHDNIHFPIELAFGEPEIVRGKPVIETLHQGAGLVRDIFMRWDKQGLFGRRYDW
jgi:hypothetical protein